MDDKWEKYFQVHKEYFVETNANLALIKDFFVCCSKQGLETTPDYTSWCENSYYTMGWMDSHGILIILDEKEVELTALRKIDTIKKEKFKSGWDLVRVRSSPSMSIISFKENEDCVKHLLENKHFYFDGSFLEL